MVLAVGGAWCQTLTTKELPTQLIRPGDQYYENVRSIVDWSPEELIKALPELRGLKPPQAQDDLALILRKVGENVGAFFRDFPNTTSTEQIRQQRLDADGHVTDTVTEKFYYLALAQRESGNLSLQEYRTNAKGKRIEPSDMEQGSAITRGFASMSIHFHPSYQSGSTFRFLGRQVIHGRQTYVLAFAQSPTAARALTRVDLPEKSALVLSQGVAWVDADSYQIIRMRVDLLAPRRDIGLERQTTEILFDRVRFKRTPLVLWLPRQVTVNQRRKGQAFRNRHRYSRFRLFTVEADSERKAVLPNP